MHRKGSKGQGEERGSKTCILQGQGGNAGKGRQVSRVKGRQGCVNARQGGRGAKGNRMPWVRTILYSEFQVRAKTGKRD